MPEQKHKDPLPLHLFIRASDWDAKGVMGNVVAKMKHTFSCCPSSNGRYLDETSWEKNSDKSVEVVRQYLVSKGKVENGQVVVFNALEQQPKVGLVETELVLPEEWTQKGARLKQPGSAQRALAA